MASLQAFPSDSLRARFPFPFPLKHLLRTRLDINARLASRLT